MPECCAAGSVFDLDASALPTAMADCATPRQEWYFYARVLRHKLRFTHELEEEFLAKMIS
jgi:hypothetical protein